MRPHPIARTNPITSRPTRLRGWRVVLALLFGSLLASACSGALLTGVADAASAAQIAITADNPPPPAVPTGQASTYTINFTCSAVVGSSCGANPTITIPLDETSSNPATPPIGTWSYSSSSTISGLIASAKVVGSNYVITLNESALHPGDSDTINLSVTTAEQHHAGRDTQVDRVGIAGVERRLVQRDHVVAADHLGARDQAGDRARAAVGPGADRRRRRVARGLIERDRDRRIRAAARAHHRRAREVDRVRRRLPGRDRGRRRVVRGDRDLRAASATPVSRAPEHALANSEPNRSASTTRHPRSRVGREVMGLVRAIGCGLMRVPVSWKSLAWSYGPHGRFRSLSKACGNPAASACPPVAGGVPLRG